MPPEDNNQGDPQGGQPQGNGEQQQHPGYENLLQRYSGDSGAVAVLLYQENYQLRERVRQAQANSVPQGGAVLTAEQAQAWQAYQQLGEAPALQQRLSEVDTLRTERDQLQRDSTLRDVAVATGYRFSVLRDLDRRAGGLTYTVADGAVTVRAANADPNQAQSIADYAAANWADYLPALSPPSQGQSGTPYPSQTSGQPPSKVTPAQAADAYLKRKYPGPVVTQ
jgi:hypothetical protein